MRPPLGRRVARHNRGWDYLLGQPLERPGRRATPARLRLEMPERRDVPSIPQTFDAGTQTLTFTPTDSATGGPLFNSAAGAAARRGQFTSLTDSGGTTTAVTAWTTDGHIAEIQTAAGGVTESYLYACVASGTNAGLLESVALRRSTNGGGTWAAVRSVAYAYYDGSDANGSAGDLATATVKDAAGNAVSVDYYRYYKSGDAGGYAGGLKYAVLGASYARLQTAAAALSETALTADDTLVAQFADNHFQYDSQRRVTEEVASGAGCSVCSGGLGDFTYSYTASGYAPGANSWQTKTVETLPDGNQNVVYTNSFGDVMLSLYVETATGRQWANYYGYDDAGRLILHADPSAVTGYDEGHADLVDFEGGNAQYLADAAGRVTASTYAAATTATSTAAGDAAGYLASVSLRNGELGADVPQESWTYLSHAAGGNTVYVVAADTLYRNDDGTGAETTAFAYTFLTGTNRIQSATTTPPAVTAGENGANTATSSTTYFDAHERPVWTKDAAGFLTYTAYDPATGAVVRQTTDVDAADTGNFANLPANWTTPAGGGLNLITNVQVDALARPTKVTTPGGLVTYATYDDAGHAVRTYAGWSGNGPTGPTQVYREDWGNGYTETLSMTAAPALSNGTPTGNEALGNLTALSRSFVNAAGQTIETDDYFNLGGLTYSAGNMGNAAANYYATLFGYDDRGRPDKTVSPSGTVYRTVSDGLGRVVSRWVGTNDTPDSGYWSPDNPAGMTQTEAYVYDSGAVGDGDGDLTQATAITAGGASDPDRVVQYAYDWRDRAIGMKAGVQAYETDAANRPLVVTAYDNLGEAVESQSYTSDGLALTDGYGVLQVPDASLLRAQSTAGYDELGRVYQAATYSVDPATGAVGNALVANTWFDGRGLVIEQAGPNGPVTKSAYDGAGRLTAAYVTDGNGGTSYAAASSVANDTVLSQAAYTYDRDGDILQTVTRDRLPGNTAHGALGNTTLGVRARVSYAGYYYDAGDRPVATLDVGTNGGANWTRPAALANVPARSDTALLSNVSYGVDGYALDATDPKGVVTRTLDDALAVQRVFSRRIYAAASCGTWRPERSATGGTRSPRWCVGPRARLAAGGTPPRTVGSAPGTPARP